MKTLSTQEIAKHLKQPIKKVNRICIVWFLDNDIPSDDYKGFNDDYLLPFDILIEIFHHYEDTLSILFDNQSLELENHKEAKPKLPPLHKKEKTMQKVTQIKTKEVVEKLLVKAIIEANNLFKSNLSIAKLRYSDIHEALEHANKATKKDCGFDVLKHLD